MKKWLLIYCVFLGGTVLESAHAAPRGNAEAYIAEAAKLERKSNYFESARYQFQALQRAGSETQKSLIYANIANNLTNEGLYQSASYFFLKAVSSGDDRAIRIALNSVSELVDNIGGAIFKKYLLKYTRHEQYTNENRDYFYYFLAQDHLFNHRPLDVISVSEKISKSFPLYPSLLFMRGTAYLIEGHIEKGIDDFKRCTGYVDRPAYKVGSTDDEVRELKNRCYAGAARGEYQARRYADAEKIYDEVEIESFVWPQVQYERAWNAVARGDYNRSLGRLVTYKSPGLSWFHDSEVELLRAMSFLQMCIYDDAEKEANSFINLYADLGNQIKKLLEADKSSSTETLVGFFSLGVDALKNKVQSENPMHQVLNRFIRTPYFVSLANTGFKVRKELNYLDARAAAGKKGLGGFLRDVLTWRWQMAQEMGGAFVRDRLGSEYQILLSNIKTMDIVKLEMLRRAKSKMEASINNGGVDVWGNQKKGSLGTPKLKDNQYFWDFNGEFWADELGDYVFALQPECN